MSIKDKFSRIISNDRKRPLETRMLFAYLGCETVWTFVAGIVFLALKLYTVALVYLVLFLSMMLIHLNSQKLATWRPFKDMYSILTLISVPFVWYMTGGNESSANVLFVIEIVLFIITYHGPKQIVLVICTLTSTSLIYALSYRFPHLFTGYTMTGMQHYIASIVTGSIGTIWVAFLMMFQKKEYTYENDRSKEMSRELERSNQMQKTFLANMSHEIRSPLGIILGFNDLIADLDDVNQIHEYSQNISDAGRTLQVVINDILDYSKIEAGKLDIIENDYNFNDLIKEIESNISLRASDKGLDFNVIKKGILPKFLFGDSVRIRQCLLNLLTNAVKYTDKGKVTLEIEGETAEGGVLLNFTVRDTGKGIEKELQGKLFDAFQRLDEGHHRGIEGTGLGLAITKSLLDEMDGHIYVDSTIGVGTSFIMEIFQKIGVGQDANSDAEKDNISIDGISVLLVDDTALNLKLIDKILSKHGATVKSVDNGRDAIEESINKKYDIILMDHMMPEMDGIEAFRRIGEQSVLNAHTPVIMMTANAMAGAKQEYLSIGFTDYISKPINGVELIKMVREYGRKTDE